MLPFLLFTELMIWCFCTWRGIKFLFAKSASYRWVIAQHQHIFTRKKFIHSLRKRTDWQVLKCLSWNFEWKQFFLLGRERGTSIRRSLHGDEIFREKILSDWLRGLGLPGLPNHPDFYQWFMVWNHRDVFIELLRWRSEMVYLHILSRKDWSASRQIDLSTP